MQDRVVRTCAREKIRTIEEAQKVLEEEVERINFYQVHSTTGEVPAIRFQRAVREKKSLNNLKLKVHKAPVELRIYPDGKKLYQRLDFG